MARNHQIQHEGRDAVIAEPKATGAARSSEARAGGAGVRRRCHLV